MIELLKYLGLFCVASACLLIVWAFTMYFLGFLEQKQAKWKNITAASSMISILLFAFLALSAFHVYPPRLYEKISPPDSAGLRKEVEAVDSSGKQLIAAFEHPESLTLQQLRDLVDKVRVYATQATALNQVQETQIVELRKTVEQETAKAKQAEDLAAKVKSITSEQLDAVKFLITKDANEQARQSFTNGVIASFPLGVLASIIGAAFWDRFRPKKRQALTTIERAITGTMSPTPDVAPIAGDQTEQRA